MQRAVDELRRLIFSGVLAPGSNHLEAELAERLGMSRTPVREAARVLQVQGLVELRPRKGLRVLALSLTDMSEIYEVLTELESLAAENAARFGYSDDDLAPLAAAIDIMDRALDNADLDAWAAADDAFHAELVRLGRNSRVVAIAAMMADQVRRAKTLTLRIRPLPLQSNADHRSVYEAVRAGQPALARNIHHSHRSNAKNLLLGLLERLRLRQV